MNHVAVIIFSFFSLLFALDWIFFGEFAAGYNLVIYIIVGIISYETYAGVRKLYRKTKSRAPVAT